MTLNAGRLTEEIEILREVADEENGSGGWNGGWIPLVTTRAEVKRVKGSRNLEAAQVVHNEPYEIVTRYRVDVAIDEHVKILHRGKNIILHSMLEEDFKHRVYKYFGYATATTGGGINEESGIQLYESGEPQLYETGEYQRYEE
jgi:SPP1 family predicted phage head-tail adaptor